MADVVTLSADEQAAVTAFWWQRVYFDGTPLRRWEVVPKLAATPGMTEVAALSYLLTAEPADDSVSFSADFGKGDDLDPEGNWITVTHQHVHTTKDGKIDAGGGPHIRKMLGQQTIGDRVRGAAGKVGKVAKNIGKAAGRLEDRLNSAVEGGSDRAYNYLKDKGKQGLKAAATKGKAAVARGKELAKKYGPIAKAKAKEYAKKGAAAAGRGAYKAAGAVGKAAIKVGGAAAKKVGGAVKSGMSWLWKKLKEKAVGKPKSVDEKLKDVKNKIREKRKEGKLDRLNKRLESLSGKGGPAPEKASKSPDIKAAAPKADPPKADPPKSSGGGGGAGGGGGSFHERMKAAKAAKASKSGGSSGGGSASKKPAKPKDDDDEASRMPWDKSSKSSPKKPSRPDAGSEADLMPWDKAPKSKTKK